MKKHLRVLSTLLVLILFVFCAVGFAGCKRKRIDTPAPPAVEGPPAVEPAYPDEPGTAAITTLPKPVGNLVYNGQNRELAIAGAADGGVMKYSLDKETWSETIPVGKDAGEYVVWYKVFGDFEHANDKAGKITCFIEKAVYDTSGIVFADAFHTFDGTEKTLVATGVPEGIDVTYEDNTLVNAGSVTATAMFAVDANHEAVPDRKAVLTIKKAAYNIDGIRFEDATYLYDGTEKTLTATGIPEGVTATYENNARTNIGSVTATAKFAVDANHESIPSMTAVLTITEGQASVTTTPASISGLVYNGQNQALVTAGAALCGAMKYSLDKENWSETIPEVKDAGEYVVWYKAFGEDGYADTGAVKLTCRIEKKAYDTSGLRFESATYVYDGTEKTLSATGIPEGVTATYENNTLTNAGSITATAKFAVDSNHESIPSMTAVLTITEGQASVTTAPASISGLGYNGQEQTLITAGAASGGVMKYSLDKETWDETIPAGKDAGEYDVWYKVFGNEGYADTNAVKLTCRIEKKAYDTSGLKFEDATYVYDGTEKTLVANGVPDGVTPSYTLNKRKTPGSTEVTASFAVDDNHEAIPDRKAVLAIKKRPLGISWSVTSFPYDGNGHTPEATLTNVLDGEVCEITVSGQGKETGIYAAEVSVGGADSGNYEQPAVTTIKFTIGDVVLPAEGLIYNGEGQALLTVCASAAGNVKYSLGDSPDGAFYDEIPTAVEAGTYTVRYVIEGVPGAEDPVSLSCVIAKANPEVVVPEAKNGIFDTGEVPLVTQGGAEGGTMLYAEGEALPAEGDFTEEIPVKSAAGTYVVWYRVKGDRNYNDIPPRSIKVTLIPKSEVTEGLVYEPNSNGTAYVVAGKGTAPGPEIVIPKYHEGKPVTGIKADAFENDVSLTGIAIPDSVNAVEAGAFNGCTNLTTVKMPAAAIQGVVGSLKTILTKVEIVCGTVPDNAFVGCTNLASVKIGNGVSKIGAGAFKNCTGMVTLDLGNGVTVIGNNAFEGCSNSGFEELTIPDSVQTIGAWAFYKCAFKTVSFGEESRIYSMGESSFRECPQLTSFVFPGTLTTIGSYVLYKCANLESVVMKDGITAIPNYAFAEDYKLTDVTIPDSVTLYYNKPFNYITAIQTVVAPAFLIAAIPKNSLQTITITSGNVPDDALKACANLKTVTIGKDVGTIGANAFSGCAALDSLIFEDGSALERIGTNAFSGCTSLETIDVPDSVSSIGKDAFLNTVWWSKKFTGVGEDPAYGLVYAGKVAYVYKGEMPTGTELTLIAGTKGIGDCAFQAQTNLTKAILPEGLLNVGELAFDGCSALAEAAVPEGVLRIGQSAFRGCAALSGIGIPSSVTTIGLYAFHGCAGVSEAKVAETNTAYHSGVTENGVRKEYNCIVETATGTLIFSCGLTDELPPDLKCIAEGAFAGRTTLTSITIPDSVTSIKKNAFLDCVNLAEVTIPSSQPAIDAAAFAGCANLTKANMPVYGAAITAVKKAQTTNPVEVNIAEGTTNIDYEAFRGWTNLSSVTIPETVTEIGEGAFRECSKLSSIEIPASVVKISDNAFKYCFALASVKFAENGALKTIGGAAFSQCTSLTDVSIPDSVTDIPVRAISNYGMKYYGTFEGCTALKTVRIGKNIKKIDIYAFRNCSTLESVTFAEPSAVAEIADSAFDGCKALAAIDLPASVTGIGNYAFSGCETLAAVTLAEGSALGNIGEGAFKDCKALAAIDLPAGVGAIGKNAFLACESLKTVTAAEGVVADIGEGAFSGCAALESVGISGAGAIGKNAFLGCESLQAADFVGNSTLTVIPEGAFNGCKALAAVTIPAGVTEIGISSFEDCASLSSMNIPASVETIGQFAFRGCSGMNTLTVEEGNNSYESKENCVISKGSNTLVAAGIGSVIPDGVEKIAAGAFKGLSGLTEIVVPESVDEIGEDAFLGYTGLTKVKIRSLEKWCAIKFANADANPLTVARDLWLSADGGETYSQVTALEIPDIDEIKNFAFYNGIHIDSVRIPEGVGTIGAATFTGCVNIKTAEMPVNAIATIPKNSIESVTIAGGTTIPSNAFFECTSLKEVTIKSGITKIDGWYNSSWGYYWGAFSKCTSLNKITIPDTVTEVYLGSFKGTNITEAVMPAVAIGAIKYSAYYEGDVNDLLALKTVKITNGEIPNGAFQNCSCLESVTIGDEVTRIGFNAFISTPWYTNTLLPSFTEENCVVYIATEGEARKFAIGVKGILAGDVVLDEKTAGIVDGAFANQSTMSSITIPAGVKYICENVFTGCAGLGKVVVKDLAAWCGIDFAKAEDNPLFSAHSLWVGDDAAETTELSIPSTVSKIGNYAFAGCTHLTKVSIDEGATAIGTGSFKGCVELADVSLPSTINKINQDAFNGCGKLGTITYAGTMAQWGTVTKVSGWNTGVPAETVVTCSDGTAAMS